MGCLCELLFIAGVVMTVYGLMGWTIAGTEISALSLGVPLLVVSFTLGCWYCYERARRG